MNNKHTNKNISPAARTATKLDARHVRIAAREFDVALESLSNEGKSQVASIASPMLEGAQRVDQKHVDEHCGEVANGENVFLLSNGNAGAGMYLVKRAQKLIPVRAVEDVAGEFPLRLTSELRNARIDVVYKESIAAATPRGPQPVSNPVAKLVHHDVLLVEQFLESSAASQFVLPGVELTQAQYDVISNAVALTQRMKDSTEGVLLVGRKRRISREGVERVAAGLMALQEDNGLEIGKGISDSLVKSVQASCRRQGITFAQYSANSHNVPQGWSL